MKENKSSNRIRQFWTKFTNITSSKIGKVTGKELAFIFSIFFILVLFGSFSLDDYGIHVDDFIQAKYGELISLKLVNPNNNNYLNLSNLRFYGPIYEVFLHLIISFFGLTRETIDFFYTRKFITYIIFLIGCLFYYLLLRRHFNFFVTSIATLLLFSIPSYFGYAQVTTKEIPLISFTIISFYFLDRYLKETTRRNIFLHFLFLSVAIAIRPSALTYLPITFLFILTDEIKNYKRFWKYIKQRGRPLLLNLILAVVTIFTVVLIFDPHLREDPFNRYIERLEFMSSFDNEGSIMIDGQVMKVSESKTADMFVIGLKKVPEIFMLFSLTGFITGIVFLFKTPLKKTFTKNRLFIIGFLWLFIPLLSVFIKETKFYNFRHLLIFLPPLGIFLAYGINLIVKRKDYFGKVFVGIIILGSIYQTYTIFKLFPYEIAYFNEISGGLQKNSELYSNYPEGLAEAEAIIKVCEDDEEVLISGPFVSIYLPYYCQNAKYSDKYEQSDYIITYDFYEKLQPVPNDTKLINTIERDNASILNTYKTK